MTNPTDIGAASRPRNKLNRVVVVAPEGGTQEFWAEEFNLSYQDGGKTLKLIATGTAEQAEQARSTASQALARDLSAILINGARIP